MKKLSFFHRETRSEGQWQKFMSLLSILFALLLFHSCSGIIEEPDTEPPVINLPTIESVYTEIPSLAVLVSDNKALESLEILKVEESIQLENLSGKEAEVTFLPPSLEEGINTFQILAKDEAGNSAQEILELVFELPQELDTEAPSISLPDTSGVYDSYPLLTIGVEDNLALASLVISQGDATILDEVLSEAQEEVSFQPTSLAEGTNTFLVTATDAAGNNTEASLVIEYEEPEAPDTQAPVINLPDTSGVYNSVPSLAISVQDDKELASLVITQDTVTLLTQTLSSTSAQVTFQPASEDLITGTNTFVVSVSDSSGNSSEEVLSFDYNDQAPEAELTFSPDQTAYQIAPLVTADVSDVLGLSLLELLQGDTVVDTSTLNGTSAQYSFDLSELGLTSGNNPFSVRVTNTAGTVAEENFQILLDLEAPTGTVSFDTSITWYASPDVEYSLNDVAGLDRLELYHQDNLLFTENLNGNSATGIIGSTEYTSNWIEGENTLEVRTFDIFGHSSTTEILFSFVTNEAPEIAEFTLEEGTNTSPEVSFSVQDITGGISKIELFVNDEVEAIHNIEYSDHPTSLDLTLDELDYEIPQDLAQNSTHSLSVVITDIAGLSQSAEGSFYLDKEAPKIYIYFPNEIVPSVLSADHSDLDRDLTFGSCYINGVEVEPLEDKILDDPDIWRTHPYFDGALNEFNFLHQFTIILNDYEQDGLNVEFHITATDIYGNTSSMVINAVVDGVYQFPTERSLTAQ